MVTAYTSQKVIDTIGDFGNGYFKGLIKNIFYFFSILHVYVAIG